MGQLLTSASVLLCPHGGKVNAVSTNVRAQALGGFILRPSDTFVIAGCPFQIPAVPPPALIPSPCVKVQWVVPGLRGTAEGDSVLTTDSVGLCLSAANVPQGPVSVVFTQPRVSGQ